MAYITVSLYMNTVWIVEFEFEFDFELEFSLSLSLRLLLSLVLFYWTTGGSIESAFSVRSSLNKSMLNLQKNLIAFWLTLLPMPRITWMSHYGRRHRWCDATTLSCGWWTANWAPLGCGAPGWHYSWPMRYSRYRLWSATRRAHALGNDAASRSLHAAPDSRSPCHRGRSPSRVLDPHSRNQQSHYYRRTIQIEGN